MFYVSQKLISLFTDIANAIRFKLETTEPISPINFYSALEKITEDKLESKILGRITKITEKDSENCTTINDYALTGCTQLSQVSFPNCITIGNNAFDNCTQLSQVSFPNCITIGNNAFANCTQLSQVSFPNCTTIEEAAFRDCIQLSQVSFPNCTTIGGYAFIDCTQLSQISFPNCTTIGSKAFQNCSQLTSLYLPGSIVCQLLNADAFQSTRITSTSMTGSIFVPASLLSNYKSANNWSIYSSKIFAIEENI